MVDLRLFSRVSNTTITSISAGLSIVTSITFLFIFVGSIVSGYTT